MEKYEHLRLPPITENIERQTRAGGGGYTSPSGRNKADFARQAVQKADEIKSSFANLKNKFSGKVSPSLIYEIKVNQSVGYD